MRFVIMDVFCFIAVRYILSLLLQAQFYWQEEFAMRNIHEGAIKSFFHRRYRDAKALASSGHGNI